MIRIERMGKGGGMIEKMGVPGGDLVTGEG